MAIFDIGPRVDQTDAHYQTQTPARSRGSKTHRTFDRGLPHISTKPSNQNSPAYLARYHRAWQRGRKRRVEICLPQLTVKKCKKFDSGVLLSLVSSWRRVKNASLRLMIRSYGDNTPERSVFRDRLSTRVMFWRLAKQLPRSG